MHTNARFFKGDLKIVKVARFIISLSLCAMSLAWTLPAPAVEELSYDVVVAGGGAGGSAAAIQAARLGASVAIIEETGTIGGQMTAAAVSTMDDMYGNRSGLYGEFIDKVKARYNEKGKSLGTCYWSPITIAFEPHIGEAVLYEMIEETRKGRSSGSEGSRILDVYLRSSVKRVLRQGDKITGVEASLDGRTVTIRCEILIDATEYGDILPLAGARYRAGNVLFAPKEEAFLKGKTQDMDARIQDITWVAVIKAYPGEVPPHLRVALPPPGYEKMREVFKAYVTRDGFPFKGYPVKLPVNVPTHNAYRGLPHFDFPGDADASTPFTRLLLTKTGVNWANDYPGGGGYAGKSGLPVRYFEDYAFRREINAQAMLKTLGFLYYIQNELNLPWSVADDEFGSSDAFEAVRGLVPYVYEPLVRHFPPIPYVRESRRLVGIKTLTSFELRKNSESYRSGGPGHEIPTSVAVGRYVLDLHGSGETEELESEFGETAESIAKNKPVGPFQVPFEIFIPEKIDGLLAAEKNLSMTRLASGALRLQPICMLTGQAAGAIAGLAVKYDVSPRYVDPLKVQRALLEAGSALALCHFSDVPKNHPFWPAVQIATVRGWIKPIATPTSPAPRLDDLNGILAAAKKGSTKGIFGAEEPLTSQAAERLIRRALEDSGRSTRLSLLYPQDKPLTVEEFAVCLMEAFFPGESPMHSQIERREWALKKLEAFGALKGIEDFDPKEVISRAQAADIVMRLLTAP
ncbi:MAG: hypothetical protein PWR28_1573 [Synergistaceae bacterium]|nr:hypothetical protein [Synergistaceae bacterium]